MNGTKLALTVVAALILSIGGCGDDKPEATAEADAGKDAGAGDALGGRVDEVMKSVPGSASPGGKGDPNQPPPNGIFAPGVADRALAPGAPPKIELFDDGADPKIALLASVPKGKEQITLVVQAALAGKPLLPPLLFMIEIGPPGAVAPAPEEPKKGAAGGSAAPKPAPAATASAAAPAQDLAPMPESDHPLVATITAISIPGVADPPKQAMELLDVMKGATFSFTMTKTGPTSFTRSFAKDVDKKVAQLLDIELGAIEDALTAMYTPAPSRPVGEGAYWMVTDRRNTFGTEIVRYRVFKVTEVDGDTAELSIDIRQYAVNDKSVIAELTQLENPVMIEYAAVGKGKVLVGPGSRFAKAGQVENEINTAVIPSAAKGNPQAPRAELGFQLAAQLGVKEAPPEKRDKPKDDAKDKKPKKPAPAPAPP